MKFFYAIALLIFFSSCNNNSTIEPKIKIAVINRGVGGFTSADVAQHIDSMLNLKADITILMIGTNDVGIKQPYDVYTRNLKYSIDKIQKSGTKLILMSPPPRGTDYITSPAYFRNGRNDTIVAINDSLSKVFKCYYLNINQIFKDAGTPNPTTRSLIFNNANNPEKPDGIHLTGAGARFLASTVYKFITSNFANDSYTKILCIGDSLTEGDKTGYPTHMSALFNK